MGRGGQPKDRSDGPERKCIATGEVQPKHGLIRFVIGPESQIAPDLAEKLPGRGIWVSADRAALAKAAKKGLFARAARGKRLPRLHPFNPLAHQRNAILIDD